MQSTMTRKKSTPLRLVNSNISPDNYQRNRKKMNRQINNQSLDLIGRLPEWMQVAFAAVVLMGCCVGFQ